MSLAPVTWNGQDLYQPGVYAQRDITKLNVGGASGSRLLLIGECTGGIPYNATTEYPNADDRVNWVSNTTDLKELIIGGAAYYGALFALTPSNDPGVNGAPAVGVIRVNPAIQSSDTAVKDKDNATVGTITSRAYGSLANQIRFKVEDGTNKGKKITTNYSATTLVYDDCTKELFSIHYTGTAGTALLEINPAGGAASFKITTSGANVPADDISIDLANYTTVNSLVNYLNNHASTHYTAVLIGDASYSYTLFDKVVAGDAVNVATAYTVKADLQAAIDYFNNVNSLVTFTYTGSARRPLGNVAYHYLTGGSDGSTPATQDWTDALDMAKLVDASFVVCMTSDSAVQAALSTHCTEMSSITGKNERQGFIGSVNGDSKSTKISDAQSINNMLMNYVGTEIYRYDVNGTLTLWDGFYTAAMIAGMIAGNSITFSPTNKSLNILGVKEKYTSTVIDDYIKGGVVVIQPSNQGGYRVIRAITTYQSANIIANEMSAVREILYVTKDHRAYVEGAIGEAGDSATLESVRNRAELRLKFYEDQKIFIYDPAFGNSFRNFTFTVTADTVKIDYEATIVLPINFILVSHTFTVIGFKG